MILFNYLNLYEHINIQIHLKSMINFKISKMLGRYFINQRQNKVLLIKGNLSFTNYSSKELQV